MAQMAALTAFSPLTTILSADTNGNNTTIRSTYNAHDIATSSVHGITSPSLIVGTNESQLLINKTNNTLVDIRNLSLALSGGVLAIKSADGATALSSTNKGIVSCGSATLGRVVELEVTANISINDLSSGSSNLVGLTFGVTSGINWALDMPWYLYVVNRTDQAIDGTDSKSAFFLSRTPNYNVTPLATYIGKSGTPPATNDQYAIILMGTVYTSANYASLPCKCLGAVRVRYTGASTDWTFQTLTNNDGFNRFHEGTRFYMPVGQNGSAATSYFHSNGGTAPTYVDVNVHYYYVQLSGLVFGWYNFDSTIGGTAGAGAVTLRMSIPLKSSNDGNQITQRPGNAVIVNGAALNTFASPQISKNTSYITFIYQSTTATVLTTIQNANQNDPKRQVTGFYCLEAFGA